jgi:7,8-dihydropterin-6-yl-methyl-4-(beta-D-ribofuranosyl)aminobenzene 5'-phosphate synthase
MSFGMSGVNINPIITVIYDNNPYKDGLEMGWGFFCVIKGLEKTILFDTGGDGQRLLANMRKLDIDPKEIDIVVISHIHGDHAGGLRSILERNQDIVVYLPISFPKSFKDEVKSYGAKIVEVQRHLKICKNLHSTGELGTGIKEQSLIVRTDKGLIVITGCAHPGVVEILNKVRDLMKNDFFLLMGGYHLGGKGKGELEKIFSSFKKMGVRNIGPCHCTGDAAKELFKKEYQTNFINVGVGKVITMEDLK